MGIINSINDILWTYILIVFLLGCAIWFTFRTRFVQFRMISEMMRLLGDSAGTNKNVKHISSFQAFAISIASRVGTGNLAGVATAIAVGGPGAVFWMWIIALFGASSSFVESTLAQLYKERGKDSYIGGPAYYMRKGLKLPWMGTLFALLITVTFGFAFNSVQSNTLCAAFENAFGLSHTIVGVILTALTVLIIFGGVQRIAKVSSIIVPIMALGYIALAVTIVLLNITELPTVISQIVSHAFGWNQALGGGIGAALMQGIKRGLFSNEAGMGSAPNVAATAHVSHPVKQGLIQTLGVFTDTLIISTRWFSQRSATHPTCFDKRNRSLWQYIRSSGIIFLCIQQHLGKLLLRRGQYTLPHPSKMDTEHLSLISRWNGTFWGIGNIGYGMGAGRHHYGINDSLQPDCHQPSWQIRI